LEETGRLGMKFGDLFYATALRADTPSGPAWWSSSRWPPTS